MLPMITILLVSQDSGSEVMLGLEHLQGAFYLLFLGICIGSISFLIETQ